MIPSSEGIDGIAPGAAAMSIIVFSSSGAVLDAFGAGDPIVEIARRAALGARPERLSEVAEAPSPMSALLARLRFVAPYALGLDTMVAP